jgi:hypothetical protein
MDPSSASPFVWFSHFGFTSMNSTFAVLMGDKSVTLLGLGTPAGISLFPMANLQGSGMASGACQSGHLRNPLISSAPKLYPRFNAICQIAFHLPQREAGGGEPLDRLGLVKSCACWKRHRVEIEPGEPEALHRHPKRAIALTHDHRARYLIPGLIPGLIPDDDDAVPPAFAAGVAEVTFGGVRRAAIRLYGGGP